ncbi:MAG: hypothetical protein H6667_06855 [Ardenticatenaceae bacterium]|nr:hypothetical protein [Ardenticatenaceae bacterium]MCB9445096.1 hypothetical protein [Ardenticatenaceae bacterium]
MSKLDKDEFVERCIREGPQAAMEKSLIEAYLNAKGHSLKELQELPKEQARALMVEACEYACLRLAQVESTARFRDKIQGPS